MALLFMRVREAGCAYSVLDTETYKYTIYKRTDSTKEIEEKVKDSYGTALFINREIGVYGVVKDRKKRPSLTWISIGLIEKSNNTLGILNTDGKITELIDLTHMGIDMFDMTPPKGFSRTYSYMSESSSVNIGKDRFLKDMGFIKDEEHEVLNNEQLLDDMDIENVDDTIIDNENVDEPSLDEDEPVDNIISESNEKTKDTFEEYNNWLENKLEEYYVSRKERDELIRKETEAEELSKRALDMIATLHETEDENTVILDVDKIVSSDDTNNVQSVDLSKYVIYELLLKVLKVNDSVSIPTEYYNQLKVILRKSFYMSRNLDIYTSIVDIKLGNDKVNNLSVIVDYNANEEYTRITVLKTYNEKELSANELAILDMKYQEWKRKNSYTFN